MSTFMKNRSFYLLFDVPKISPETLIAISYLLRGLISSPISLLLILDFEYCSGGDLLIRKTSRLGIREKMFNIRFFSAEKDGPTKSVRFFMRSSLMMFFHKI